MLNFNVETTEVTGATEIPCSGIRPKKSRCFASLIIIWTFCGSSHLDIHVVVGLQWRNFVAQMSHLRLLEIVSYDVTNYATNSAVLAFPQFQRYAIIQLLV